MSLWSDQRTRVAALTLGAAAACWTVPAALGAPQAAASGVRPELSLVDQSQWVEPPADGAPATFTLTLEATGAPPSATVTVTLYTRLRTRSAFEEAASSGPTGYQLAQTGAQLAALAPSARSPGGLDLTVAVTTSAQASSPASAGPSLNLACAPPTGSGTCPGVYPVVVALHASGATTRFTTFLTYAASKSAHPLDVAWVVPMTAPVHVRPRASSPSRAVAPMSPAHATALEGLVDELRASPTVPVTLEPSPQTLQALDASGAAGRTAVATLASLSANQAVDEISAAPYVPVDLGALAAGDSAEVAAQMSEGAATLQRLHVATSAPTAWTATQSLDGSLAAGMSQAHAGILVVPGTALSTPSSADTGSSGGGTWAAPFSLQLARSTRKGTGTAVTAAAADGTLQRQFATSGGDPALAATQLLADLAMVHFERPNDLLARGVVAEPPAGWAPTPSFDRVLLEGLTANPDVAPVTLAKYLATVPNGGTRSVSSAPKGPGLGAGAVRTLVAERRTLTEFQTAVTGAPAALTSLDELLLDTEDGQWRPGTRAAASATFHRVLERQLHLVRFATGGTVTLTARTGWIPITVVSSAPYTVVGTLSVNGNEKFEFPHGSSQAMTLDHATNARRVDVVARSSGDLALTATFTTPRGTLVLASSTLTVRSTGTSVVGIVLTAAALGVLLAWWARTWWAARRRRGRLRSSRGVGS